MKLGDWRTYFHADQEPPGWHLLTVLLTVGAILSGAAVVGLIWIAGWREVVRALLHAHWILLVIAPVCVLLSHLGYALAYREIARVERGPELGGDEVVAIVASGFGMVSPRGGFALDAQELRKRGLSRQDAQLRVRVLGALEYVVLAPATFAAALYMLTADMRTQGGVLASWVIGVPVGGAIALGILATFQRAGRPRSWWRPLRHWLEAFAQTLKLLVSWPAGQLAILGMGVYWACDIAALVSCMDVFTHRRGMTVAMIVGYATGYALTRRSLPLGGAGIVEILLPVAMTWVGFPLAASILGVVAYRAFNLWVAVIPASLGVRRLRMATVGAQCRTP